MTSFQETQGASLNESYHGSKDLKVGKQTPENKNSPLLLPPNPSKTNPGSTVTSLWEF